MCKSRAEGGQRCYSHARKALDAAYAARDALAPRRLLHALGNTEALPGHVDSAIEGRILRAQIDLASTARGRAEFRTQADRAATRGDHVTADRIRSIIERGELLQERNAALCDLNRNGRRTGGVRLPTTSRMALTPAQIREHLAMSLKQEQAEGACRDLEATLGRLGRSTNHRSRVGDRRTDTLTWLMVQADETETRRGEYNRRAQRWAVIGEATRRLDGIAQTPGIDASTVWQRFIAEMRHIRDHPPDNIAFADYWRGQCNFVLRVCGEIAHEHTRPRNNGPQVSV